jgi:cell wall-associated NlpC family hydrolase
MREAAAQRELARIAATKKTLAEEKAEIDDKAAEAEELLDRLEARAAPTVSRSSSTRLPNVAVSGRAGAAVQYALGQVGDSYVYGAAGPDAFDCSGLTMMAWAAAGVSLPHSSGAQMGSGTPVSQSQLAPGDLVFYYSPVSHVGIYIGNGQIVHAANPSTGVQVAPVFSMPYSGAVRPG